MMGLFLNFPNFIFFQTKPKKVGYNSLMRTIFTRFLVICYLGFSNQRDLTEILRFSFKRRQKKKDARRRDQRGKKRRKRERDEEDAD